MCSKIFVSCNFPAVIMSHRTTSEREGWSRTGVDVYLPDWLRMCRIGRKVSFLLSTLCCASMTFPSSSWPIIIADRLVNDNRSEGSLDISLPYPLDISDPFVRDTMTDRVPTKILGRTVKYNENSLPKECLEAISTSSLPPSNLSCLLYLRASCPPPSL